MPFKSKKQMRWMYANKPEMAREWSAHTPDAKRLPDVAKLSDKKLRDVTKLALARRGMVGKMGNAHVVHTFVFDKKSFPTRESVNVWIRGKKALGAKQASIVDKPGEWHVRQAGVASAGLETQRLRCDIGVQAIIGIPMQKSLPIEGRPQTIGVTVRPETQMPTFPDWENIYFSPEATKRQQKEADASKQRRRSSWRDLNFSGFHGVTDDKVELKYEYGKTSTGDVATMPVHYLTADKLRQNQKRITGGVSYENINGKPKR